MQFRIVDNTHTGDELIETLWNVNIYVPVNLILVITELIETLWNVNNFATGSVELKLKN